MEHRENKVVFSVVTVCYNEEKTIRNTIESVLSQSYPNFEYIICDGGSTDETFRIAQSYQEAFAEKNVPYRVSSQKDGGIYFGMNNGIRQAEGEYLHFLNAGDRYSDDQVLEIAADKMEQAEADIYYGDVFFIERNFGKLLKADLSGLDSGMSICHQGMFIRTSLMKQQPYNTEYRIVADYDFTLDMRNQGKVFSYIDYPIAAYQAGGVSTTQVERIAKEYVAVKKKAGIACDFKTELRNAKKNLRSKLAKEKMPLWLWNFYNRKRGRMEMR